MNSRYFLMENREISGDVIDIRTRRPVLAAAPAALPPAKPGGEKRQLMPTGKYLGLWLDVTASLAIVAVCAAFWISARRISSSGMRSVCFRKPSTP